MRVPAVGRASARARAARRHPRAGGSRWSQPGRSRRPRASPASGWAPSARLAVLRLRAAPVSSRAARPPASRAVMRQVESPRPAVLPTRDVGEPRAARVVPPMRDAAGRRAAVSQPVVRPTRDAAEQQAARAPRADPPRPDARGLRRPVPPEVPPTRDAAVRVALRKSRAGRPTRDAAEQRARPMSRAVPPTRDARRAAAEVPAAVAPMVMVAQPPAEAAPPAERGPAVTARAVPAHATRSG